MTVTHDAVDHPAHYNSHPSLIEAIEVTENYMTNLGNPIKYLWRLGQKDASAQELGKAKWYVKREISYLHRFQNDKIYRVSFVANKGHTLGLIERYLAHEPEGTLRDVKELIMRAPFYVQSVDALETAVSLLDILIREARLKEVHPA